MYVCGRAKDLIIIRGCNYYPQDIEQACCRHPNVKQGSVAAFSVERGGEEVLVVALELRTNHSTLRQLQEDVRFIRQQIANDIGIALYELVILEEKTIIKTTSGKISRHAVRQAYEQNALHVVFCDRNDLMEKVVEENRQRLDDRQHHPSSIPSSTNNNNDDDDDDNNNPMAIPMSDQVREGEMTTEQENPIELLLPSAVDGINTLCLHGDELEDVLLEDVCYLCGVQSYMVNVGDSLEMMGLDSLRRAQLKGILEQLYGANIENELLFNVNTSFRDLVQAVDVGMRIVGYEWVENPKPPTNHTYSPRNGR